MSKVSDLFFFKKYLPSAIVRFEKINKYSENVDLCLDLGCSVGILTLDISKKCKTVVGFEIRKDAIKVAKSICPKNCLFVIGDGTQLPFKENVYDQIISSEVIEHIRDYKKYLIEVNRVLKHDSVFLFTTPNRIVNFPSIGPMPALSVSWFLGKLTRNPLFIFPYGHYYGGFSPTRLKRELSYFGFKVERIDFCGFWFVKLIDDIAYIAAVQKGAYDDVMWYENPKMKYLNYYKKFLPLIRKLIKIDSVILDTGLEGYINLFKIRKSKN